MALAGRESGREPREWFLKQGTMTGHDGCFSQRNFRDYFPWKFRDGPSHKSIAVKVLMTLASSLTYGKRLIAMTAPAFSVLFPETRTMSSTTIPVSQTRCVYVLPLDASGGLIDAIGGKAISLPITVKNADSASWVRRIHDDLCRLLEYEVVITDIRPLALLPKDSLLASARILNFKELDPNSGGSRESRSGSVYAPQWCSEIAATLGASPTFAKYYDEEIQAYRRIQSRYVHHRTLFYPFRNLLARVAKVPSTNDLASFVCSLIAQYAGRGESLIDLACGDSGLSCRAEIASKFSLVVRNDIACQLLFASECSLDGYATTCLDATNTPFKSRQFAVSLCKNVIHHMPSGEAVGQLLAEASRISRNVIVCEILDPRVEEGTWGRLRHSYYRRYLPDTGDRFLTSRMLSDLLSSLPGLSLAVRSDFKTINGVYGCAVLQALRGD